MGWDGGGTFEEMIRVAGMVARVVYVEEMVGWIRLVYGEENDI